MTSPIITERRVRGWFFERLMQATGIDWIEAIATAPMTSDQDSEDYAWLGQVPQMVEKGGEKKFQQLRDTEWNVKNVEYQTGITIPEKHILYDKTGQVQIRVGELAERVQAHWGTLIAPLILNGAATACYDGQYFFDTDHSEGDSGTQSNSISADISTYPVANAGTTTQPSAAEMTFAIMQAIETMLAFKDDQGEYVNETMTEFLIVCGTPLLTNALQGLTSRSIDGGDGNLLLEQDSFRFRLVATPRLSSWTDKFAVFATQGQQKPIIRQQRVPNNAGSAFNAEGIAYESLWLDSEHCKKHDECLVSVETERAAAYGDWKKAELVTLV